MSRWQEQCSHCPAAVEGVTLSTGHAYSQVPFFPLYPDAKVPAAILAQIHHNVKVPAAILSLSP